MNFPPFNKLVMSANESKRCAVQVPPACGYHIVNFDSWFTDWSRWT